MGVTTTSGILPGKDWVLSFGAVAGIEVVSVKDKVDAGMGDEEVVAGRADGEGRRRTYHFSSEWIVRNRTDRAVGVRVLQSIPLSAVKELVVKVDANKSSPYAQVKEGILAFRAKANVRSNTPLELHYSVSLPADLKLY